MRFFIAIASVLALSGCGSAAQNSDVGHFHVGLGVDPVKEVTSVETTTDAVDGATSSAEVTGYSCKNKIWDPSPSRENAINLMKAQAESMGYSKIHSVKVFDDPFSPINNCWSGIKATGVAYR